MNIRADADFIIQSALIAALPDTAVKKALAQAQFGSGKLVLIAAGKAAWQMAKTASELLGDTLSGGVVITKYEHAKGDLPSLQIFEAGHPVPDENSFAATQKAIDAVSGLSKEDTVLFLLSGGGSALFEKPLVSGEELADITKQLLASGADIVEMNTVRKRLS
ncbi:MAG: glycerate-2-kinase family protein, partial [Ruthenibacterium sp.]